MVAGVSSDAGSSALPRFPAAAAATSTKLALLFVYDIGECMYVDIYRAFQYPSQPVSAQKAFWGKNTFRQFLPKHHDRHQTLSVNIDAHDA
jgi:hypothetical protein